MQSHELKIGRTFGVTFEHGENFFDALKAFCQENEVRQGYIPMFIAGFAWVDLVGACDKLEDPNAPVWSKVHLTNVEAVGAGTIAYDDEAGGISPHVHVSVGQKERSAVGATSHLLGGQVLFLTEMVVVEVQSPMMQRPRCRELYEVPLLRWV